MQASNEASPLKEQPLQEWFQQAPGMLLEEAERSSLEYHLANVFGYHLALVAPPWESSQIENSRIPHKVTIANNFQKENAMNAVQGLPEQLPLLSDSLDALILPHTLELSTDPHQVLREAERCLIPEGYLFITGFNPVGVWGLWRAIAGVRKQIPWSLQFYRRFRVKEWLSLLGFDTLHVESLFFQPPIRSRHALLRFPDVFRRMDWHVFSGAYLIVARKRVVGVTPIRPRWRPRGIMSPGLVEPTRRTFYRD